MCKTSFVVSLNDLCRKKVNDVIGESPNDRNESFEVRASRSEPGIPYGTYLAFTSLSHTKLTAGFFYPGLISVRGKNVDFGDPNAHWQEWLQFYSGPAAVFVIGVAFILLLPIIGLFFCCCRCAGKCGARTAIEKRHDSCKRGTLATLLLGIAVVIL